MKVTNIHIPKSAVNDAELFSKIQNKNLIQKMFAIIKAETKKNKITIGKWVGEEEMAWAKANSIIEIPLPNTLISFGRCLHEIGHVLDYRKNLLRYCKGYAYITEYIADKYAITRMKKFKLRCKLFETDSKVLITQMIINAKNKGHNLDKVPKQIIKWCGIDLKKWK
jgi:hypothetical protein